MRILLFPSSIFYAVFQNVHENRWMETQLQSVQLLTYFPSLCTSKLVITQIIPEDDAFYQCLAENSQGSVVSTSRLIVVQSENRPSAPRNIHAETISSSAILLAWERPQYNANKVIAYSIHYMKSEGEILKFQAGTCKSSCIPKLFDNRYELGLTARIFPMCLHL